MIKQFIFVSSLVLLVGAQLVSGRSDGAVIKSDEDPIRGITDRDYHITCEQDLQDGNPAPDLEWEFNRNTLSNSSKYSVITDKNEDTSTTISILTIKNAQLEDQGMYTCHGDNRGSSATIELILSSSVTVTITDVEGDFILAVGTKIGCKVEGNTNDNYIEWFKGGTKLVPGKQDLNGDGNDDVEVTDENIVEFLRNDENLIGEYKCTKNLTKGVEESGIQMIGTAIDIDVPKSIKVSEGEDGDIICKAISIPEAEITFYDDEGELIDGTEEKYDIGSKTPLQAHEVIRVLTIKDVQPEDRHRNFTCTASNRATEQSEVIILRIRDRLAALWPFIGIVSEVIILIIIILIHEACTKGEDIGEVDDDEEDHLLQKDRTITRDGERETRMRGTNN